MMDFGSKRKTSKFRRNMLRGVYEENLNMVGKETRKQRWQKKKILFIAAPFLILVLISYIAISQMDYREPRFDMNTAAESSGQTEAVDHSLQPVPSEYNNFITESRASLRQIFGLKVKTIIIDPGHGGEDPGAIGKMGTNEKDITLDLGKRLKVRLGKYRQYKILMTREEDMTLPLEKRILYANSQHGDIYISIHVNYIPSKPINVIETYYFGPHMDQATLRLAQAENLGSQYTISNFKEIIQKMGNTLKTQESRQLAVSIQRSLFGNISRRNSSSVNYGVKTAPFVVLLGVEVPCVLTEVTCLSNRVEETRLRDRNYREAIARYLEEGIVDYLNRNLGEKEVTGATGKNSGK